MNSSGKFKWCREALRRADVTGDYTCAILEMVAEESLREAAKAEGLIHVVVEARH